MTEPEVSCVLTDWSHAGRGYGRKSIAGRMWLAHRWVWTQAHGPIPDGLLVCHSCDNPPCVALDHLFLGTYADNNADMMAKGRDRHPSGDANGRATHPERTARGSRVPWAKLTEADIPAIRARVAAGEAQTSVAARYGVTQSAISKIKRGRTWA